MNNSNKTDPKFIATSETAKVNNSLVISTQPEIKKPTVDAKKPEMTERTPFTDDKKPTVPVKESGVPNQLIPVVTKTEPVKTESDNPDKSKNPTKSD